MPKTKSSRRSVLELNNEAARVFFLKPESYCRIDLPQYFNFRPILRSVQARLAETALGDVRGNPREFNVNHTIYSNKDGRYAWRPFQLIHPVMYVDLVTRITEPLAWQLIRSRFYKFSANSKISCLSIPQESRAGRRDQGAQILHWWEGIEQGSINLALDFNHVFFADIFDCYASIYTHSVAWALHGKSTAKNRRRDRSLIGNAIDSCIQDMQHGQTNGIPQGCVLIDLVAELVLGYTDLLVGQRLTKEKIVDFRILRYRDDYRIFVNDSYAGEKILKILTEVLIALGLKLNTSKTTGAQLVIDSSVKVDKRAWLQSRQHDKNLQKHLLLICWHGIKHPNAGSLIPALNDFYKRLSPSLLRTVRNPIQLISVAVEIGYNSPRCFPVCAAIVSKFLNVLRTKDAKLAVVERIRGKLTQLPNNGHLEIWLQRISYPIDPGVRYRESLCKLVAGQDVAVWNSSWILDDELRQATDPKRAINRRQLKSLRPVVPSSEFEPFWQY